MSTRCVVKLICILVCGFVVPVFAQPLGPEMQGKWISETGETTLLILKNKISFIAKPDDRQFEMTWINSPPKDGVAPEALVAEDGEYRVCYYEGSIYSKNELWTMLLTEMLDLVKQNKVGQLSNEELKEAIDSMNEAVATLNSIIGEKFRTFACKQLFYTPDNKSYEEIGSGDVVTSFFYNEGKLYEWIKNFTLGGVFISTYNKK